ncbi:encapsulin [Methanosalsum natronophilum]|uniref:Phage major capsid protein n=1 Tax=Methanosalsum natronophilum TaxID=768733 RepID=A0A3R7X7T4_9EURY|nr:family 1 encapsulin nanocompartment shell protein [Methanosalsum natronophilum]MCS3924411.1 putative linocin/CFP29 family protein [Methanosalsum natronophilum]RQD91337.1 MAG: hypothetical protein D5R95_01150 [Methanosalsum natronophilum]
MVNALATFSKEIDMKLVEPLRRVLKGRRLVHVTEPKGFGITSVDWGQIIDLSDGLVSYAFTDTNIDSIDVTLTNSKVPVYWKDYKIDRRLYEGYLTKGLDVDASAAIFAAYKAAKAEDEAIIMGVTRDGTNYTHEGLYQGADNDYNTSKDFGTFGNATDALSGAYALLDNSDIPTDSLSFNLVIAPTQYRELRASRSTSGIREYSDVVDMLNGGDVLVSNVLSAGTGFIAPTEAVGEPYVDFYLTKDFATEHGTESEHPDTGNLYGRVYSAGILRIKQPTAICKLSDI